MERLLKELGDYSARMVIPVTRTLTLKESMALISKHRMPIARTVFSADEDGLLRECGGLRTPWVLKVSSSKAVHKTELGLVETGINSKKELSLVAKRISRKIEGLTYDALVLQEQLKGAELLIGGVRDPSFGPAIVFGSGGILVELFKDVSWRVAPIATGDAKDMIAETRAAAFTRPGGFRGKQVSLNSLTDLLMRTSRLLAGNSHILELDFNPVIAKGRSALVVDARFVVEE